MEQYNKSYYLNLNIGKGDLLRLPQSFIKDLNITNPIKTRVALPNKNSLIVIINPVDRTIFGLKPWLQRIPDENVQSIELTVIKNNPLSLSVAFSQNSPDLVNINDDSKISRPENGLFIGRKLEPDFLQVLRTNEPVTIAKEDLLQHIFICGSTGYGKTVLAKSIIEEAAMKDIPTIAIDLKGDISSLAISISGENPKEIIPWLGSTSDSDQESEASKISERQKDKLKKWGMDFSQIEHFNEKVIVNVFTPKSDHGFRTALSVFVHRPQELSRMQEHAQDEFIEAIHFMAESFVSRLTLSKRQAQKATGYIEEIIKKFWNEGVNLRGYEGLQRILDEIVTGNAGIEQIGGKLTEEYISSQDRQNISDSINTLLFGAQKLWFKGIPLDIEELINPNNYNGKTPVSIINLKHLEFNDQAYVIANIANMIWFWMKNLRGTEKPRLLFFVDEIGAGGGKQAFFPSVAITPSKKPLNLLIRQGRGYGVCCLYATQSPGDIDYKALGQCSTWAVGRLSQDLERKKIEQTVSSMDPDFLKISNLIASLSKGQFVIKTPTVPWTLIEERWLIHPIHRELVPKDLELLKQNYENTVQNMMQSAEKRYMEGNPQKALDILTAIINGYKLSSFYSNANLLIGTVLFELGKYDIAIETLKNLIRRSMDSEQIGEAYFILGKCFELKEDYEKAANEFSKVVQSEANNDIKEKAEEHFIYCKNTYLWPQLNVLSKLFHWVHGDKASKHELTKLKYKDRKLVPEYFLLVLSEKDFNIPEFVVDYDRLLEFKKIFEEDNLAKNKKQLSAETFVKQQIFDINKLLKEEDYKTAFSIVTNCINRLNASNAIAPNAFLEIIKRYNRISTKSHDGLRRRLINLKADQFEQEVANLFIHKGYKSIRTGGSHDDGVDVYVCSDTEKIIIQCKRYKKPIGRAFVDELAGTFMRKVDADRAILATTSYFSDGAVKVAKQNNIELWDLNRLRYEWNKIY